MYKPIPTDADIYIRDFDHALNLLIANVLPRIIAPKGYRARMELGTAFQQYFEDYTSG